MRKGKQAAGQIETKKSVFVQIRKHWQIYLLVLPAIIWYVLFAYFPMGGLQLAFKTYRVREGILGSPWIGFTNFEKLFQDVYFIRSVGITLGLNVLRLILVFPTPIILALMINELRLRKTKNVMQTIFTFPNFLSWVIAASIFTNVFSVDGLVNGVIKMMGGEAINFVGNTKLFWPMLILSEIWKSAGYSSIIYLAAISGIDQGQYEAADLDGASRWQKLIHITIPSIMPTISIMFIMTIGGLMTGGFDQIFNMSNAATKNAAEIVDMYIYRITFQSSADFGFSTAVSLFRSAINMALLVIADKGAKKLGGSGLIG